ncbi:MAG: hypothetical protein DRJ31_00870 [Candidatus Methanomethylicota archaeon]|uniref:Geranylgeranylglycerol-phosphate geranylgeranyltransferase n=1 Tax=Thermoproteota archaeon TaxID=2056631 RepID=A0A497ET38_9CREN|nr:MAG: hypothetical protein DRJ31_00870 [Candidatus Verstraetearchaeota archaeon]RLE52853.1 MAG: hypothetical protein DRJ33_02575 [Candidatus Verstraetearchaeota archaeon]
MTFRGPIYKTLGFIKLLRPVNCLMMGLAVAVGEFIALGAMPPLSPLLLGIATAFSLTASSMVINDYYDVEVDRINAPTRPLPSGVVSLKEAKALAIALAFIGLLAAYMISTEALLIAIAAYAISASYSSKGKKTGFLGNVMVASCVAVPFIFGSVAVVKAITTLIAIFALLSFLASIGREVTKGIVDVEGDSSKGIKTVAVLKGRKAAAQLAASLYLSAVALSILPYALGIAGILYLSLVAIADVGFVALSISILRDYSRENALKVKNRALIPMLIALISFLLSQA